MLEKAAEKGVYRKLIEADLTATLPLDDRSYAAVVSTGTFTLGHVGTEAMDEPDARPGMVAAIQTFGSSLRWNPRPAPFVAKFGFGVHNHTTGWAEKGRLGRLLRPSPVLTPDRGPARARLTRLLRAISYSDARGGVSYLKEFDMARIVRGGLISPIFASPPSCRRAI